MCGLDELKSFLAEWVWFFRSNDNLSGDELGDGRRCDCCKSCKEHRSNLCGPPGRRPYDRRRTPILTYRNGHKTRFSFHSVGLQAACGGWADSETNILVSPETRLSCF